MQREGSEVTNAAALYSIDVAHVEEDLKLLKHAFFTEPKDQGVWNHHSWLVQLVTPIQVAGVELIEEEDHFKGLRLAFSVPVTIEAGTADLTVTTDDQQVAFDFSSRVKGRGNKGLIWELSFKQPTPRSSTLYVELGNRSGGLTGRENKTLFRSWRAHVGPNGVKPERCKDWEEQSEVLSRMDRFLREEIRNI